MVRKGELPENKRFLRVYLTQARQGLIQDLSPTGSENDLSAAQKIMIDRVCNKLAILRCIEEEVREKGVFAGDKLTHVLQESYVCYANSLRLDLMALGIRPKKTKEILNLGKYIEARAKEKSGKDKDRGGIEVGHPAQSSSDSSGAQDAGAEKSQEGMAEPQPGRDELADPGASSVSNEGEGT